MPEGFLSSEEYDEQAHKLYNDGDYDGALEMLKEGLALYPNAVELYVGLGYARLAREEYAWARHAFERAAVLDPAHEDALVGLGETLLRFGARAQALRLFEQVAAMGFDEDIERNVSPDCVVLERRGVFHGRDGARHLARLLAEELPGAPYAYTNRLVEGRVAFLEWTSEAAHARVRDGADSFLIEDGWIVAQTIHYTVEPR